LVVDEQSPVIRLAAHQDSGELPTAAEDTLALLFAERHADELRYVDDWKRWLHYDGACWGFDSTLQVFDNARVVCREVALEGNKPASAVASAKTVAAVERLARCDRRLAATTAQWDAAGWLLNLKAGSWNSTVDLRTGIGRAPSPSDYITKKAGCTCAPAGTPHPLWSTFLDRVTNGDVELQKFMQRYAGYSLTGFTHEHVFVFAYGTGANGKSTFTNALAAVFGDYATVAAMSTFIASRQEQHPTDVAHLVGARLVTAQETQKGRRWDETKIKALTGGDRMSTRFMRQDFFNFTPLFKLFISGNHKPRLSNVDAAIRRRLLLLPFTVQIPPSERDTELPAKLQPEYPAILRWCVDGCLEWQRIGLSPPKTVLDAT
jgi:putative DNA primase/helicase